jgi:5'(3')-deoxyribonucleotidase
MPKNFKGVEVMSTLQKAVEKYNFTFTIFTRDPKLNVNDTPAYAHYETLLHPNPEVKTQHFNLLLCSNKGLQHIMYIKDLKALTSIHLCHKCKTYLLTKNSFNRHRDRFYAHADKCDGRFHPKIRLDD